MGCYVLGGFRELKGVFDELSSLEPTDGRRNPLFILGSIIFSRELSLGPKGS
jgi:hypothetical protein